MAIYRIKPVADWPSPWNWAKNNIQEPVTVIRLKQTDGTVVQINLDENGETSDITEPRCVRYLDVDPRFTKL